MKSIKKIYDLLYSSIITPHNLVENAKLSNYSYVNYYKGEEGLIAEMKCNVENKYIKYFYHFDEEDKLERIYFKKQSNDKKLVFDRNIELEYEKACLIDEWEAQIKELKGTG